MLAVGKARVTQSLFLAPLRNSFKGIPSFFQKGALSPLDISPWPGVPWDLWVESLFVLLCLAPYIEHSGLQVGAYTFSCQPYWNLL